MWSRMKGEASREGVRSIWSMKWVDNHIRLGSSSWSEPLSRTNVEGAAEDPRVVSLTLSSVVLSRGIREILFSSSLTLPHRGCTYYSSRVAAITLTLSEPILVRLI